jgi:predicted AAA+ superfamily ATPase
MFVNRKKYGELKQLMEYDEIIVLTGMRRVGKTTLLKQLYNEVKSGNKVFLDMENQTDRMLFDEKDYNNIWNNLMSFNITKSEKAYIFLDEIQLAPQIISPLKYLYDHYNVKFITTGSSSFYLKNLFSESLSGRKFILELFPLDFEEFLWFKGINISFEEEFQAKEKQRNRVFYEKHKALYDEYLQFGGFPQVVLAGTQDQKERYLKDIFNSYFEKDVKSLADFRNISGFRELLLLLIKRTGSKLDVSKLASALNLSRPTIYSYLSFLEQTYFISLVNAFSGSIDREISRSKKVYLCDTGIINIFRNIDEGSLFENAVFNNLKLYGKINYFQNRSSSEIDFILPEKRVALEVKNKAIPQHIQRLKRLSTALNIDEYYVISKEFADLEHVILSVNL